MSKNEEYPLIREAEEELLNLRRYPYCLLCDAEHESCLDDDEIEAFDELGMWDDEDEDEDDWEEEYE